MRVIVDQRHGKIIFVLSVSTCDDLNCEENEICVSAGDTYECVCHPDYEGEDCEESGGFD